MFAGMYPLRSINERLAEIIGACYSDNGIIREKPAVYAPYSSKSDELCGKNQVRENSLALGDKGTARRGWGEDLPPLDKSRANTSVLLSTLMLRQKNVAEAYRCGAEFLPSPMASKAEFALEATPLLTRKSHLTAVAVSVEMGHGVAFLGTASGEVRAPPAGVSFYYFSCVFFLLSLSFFFSSTF